MAADRLAARFTRVRKTRGMTESPNQFEELMMAAKESRSKRVEFLRHLASSELYVPQTHSQGGGWAARPGEEIELPIVEGPDGDVVPVFTSLAQMESFLPPGTDFVTVKGAALAEIWPPGAWMAINPKGSPGTALDAAAVKRMLDVAAAGEAEGFVVGEPKEEPAKLLDAVRSVAEAEPGIEAAYRALVSGPRTGGAKVVIGVELAPTADWETVQAKLEAATQDGGVALLGFVPVGEGGGPIVRFMSEKTEPFFRRS